MKAVIFDFDGTIADNFTYVHDIVQKLAPKYGFKPEVADDIASLRNMSMKEIVVKYHISRFNILRMLLDGRKEMKKHLPETKMPAGLLEVLDSLDQQGIKLAIISSNSVTSIREFLKNNGVGVNIDIYSSLHLFGKAKPIRKYVQKHGFTPTEVVYVGDEVRDIDSANEAGIPVISVSWGYNSKESLLKNNKLVVDNVAELSNAISSLG